MTITTSFSFTDNHYQITMKNVLSWYFNELWIWLTCNMSFLQRYYLRLNGFVWWKSLLTRWHLQFSLNRDTFFNTVYTHSHFLHSMHQSYSPEKDYLFKLNRIKHLWDKVIISDSESYLNISMINIFLSK